MSDQDEKFSSQPTRRLVPTSAQQGVIDQLRKLDTPKIPLSKWYEGALWARQDMDNPDWVPQAAHSLRELMEKLPRVLIAAPVVSRPNLKKLRERIRDQLKAEDAAYPKCQWEGKTVTPSLAGALDNVVGYVEASQMPSRSEQIASTIKSIDPMFLAFGSDIALRKTKRYQDAWLKLEGLAHHGSGGNEADFDALLEEVNDLILGLLAPVAVADQKEILQILKAGVIEPATIARVKQLIEQRGANYVLFFQKLDDPNWLDPLVDAGFFNGAPQPMISNGNVSMQAWWPSVILPRLVGKAEGRVVEIARTLVAGDNVRVLEEIAMVAAKAPTVDQSILLKDRVLEYFNNPYRWGSIDAGKILLKNWSMPGNESAIKCALDVGECLLRLVDADKEPGGYRRRASTRFQPVLDTHDFQDLVENGFESLIAVAPQKLAKIVAGKLRLVAEAEQTAVAKGEFAWRDYSEIWCADVTALKHGEDDPRVLLATLIFRACDAAVKADPATLPFIRDLLKEPGSQLFDRIFHAVCAANIALAENESRKEVLEGKAYGLIGYDLEFWKLTQTAVKHYGAKLLDEVQCVSIFEKILAGPKRESFISSGEGEEIEKRWQRARSHFHLKQLAPFEPILFKKYREYFEEITKDSKALPSAADYRQTFEGRGGMVVQRSVKTAADLAGMSDEELVGFLNEWNNPGLHEGDFLVENSFRGLAKAFADVIHDDPARFAIWKPGWSALKRPIYVQSALEAATRLIAEGAHENVEQWLEVGKYVLEQPAGSDDDEDSANSADAPSWHAARRVTTDFLEATIKKEHPIPIRFAPQLWSLLRGLCLSADPQLDQPTAEHDHDAFSLAINRTRSRALEVAVGAAFWAKDSKPLTDILAKRIAGLPALMLAERALLAVQFPNIFSLDQAWALANRASIFPRGNADEWITIMDSFLRYTNAHAVLLPAIEPELLHALEVLPKADLTRPGQHRTAIDSLGLHCFIYYAIGSSPTESKPNLLDRFIQIATPAQRATLFGQVGSMVSKADKLSESVSARVLGYFQKRITKRDSDELDHFTLWLTANCLTGEVRLKAFSTLLDKPGTSALHFFSEVHELAKLVPTHLGLVIDCFEKITALIPQTKHFYIDVKDGKTIIRAALKNADPTIQQAGGRVRDHLLKNGYQEYLEGLE